MATIRFTRPAPLPVDPTGGCRAGATEVDITPSLDLAMAGYSTEGKRARGYRGRLWARVLFLEDAEGHRAAVVVADLHSGSRFLLERTAVETATTCGITADRLILAGTHTHTGPGNFYGNTLYDTTGQVAQGFDEGFADWVSSRIASAIAEAADAARPAKLGVGVTRLWRVSRNRSLEPFRANSDSSTWWLPDRPGHGVPDGLSPQERAIDPRVTAMAAFNADDDSPIGVLATFGCHSTALGPGVDVYCADWPGWAARSARLALSNGGSGPVVAIGLSGAGDVTANTLSSDGRGVALARDLGERVGAAVAEAVGRARDAAESFDLDVRFEDRSVRERTVEGRPDTLLADDWDYGAPTVGGSEESRTLFHDLGLVREGMPGDHFDPDHPQYPKVRALGVLQELLGFLVGLQPCDRLPIHVVRLGAHVLATVPGEPTATTAFRIERALLDATPADTAMILGYAGSYSGYFATEQEYWLQHYEGSSTLYGRHSARHLRARILRLAAGPVPDPSHGAMVEFDVGARIRAFTDVSDGPALGPLDPALTRKDRRVEIRWRMPASIRLTFAEAFFVLVTRQDGAGWRPLEVDGRDFDDRHPDVLVRQFRPGIELIPTTRAWGIDILLPEELDPQTKLRVEVAPRGPFPGFRVDVPMIRV